MALIVFGLGLGLGLGLDQLALALSLALSVLALLTSLPYGTNILDEILRSGYYVVFHCILHTTNRLGKLAKMALVRKSYSLYQHSHSLCIFSSIVYVI